MGLSTDLLTLGAFGLLIYGVYRSGVFNNLQSGGGLFGSGSGGGSSGGGGGPSGTGTTFHVVGDVDCTPATAQNMAKGNPDLAINVGDFAYKCADPEEWWKNSLKAWSGPLGDRTIAVIGNHDVGEDSEYLSIFGPNQGNKWQYIKKFGHGVAFLGCNTEDVDMDELEGLLTKAQNDKSIKMIITLMHKTCFLPSKKPLKPDASKEFHNLFKRFKKVRMGFWGHNRFYARLQPIDGIQYVTVGNGGHGGNSKTSGRTTLTGAHGVLKCSVRAGPIIDCKEVLNNGTVIDSFTVSMSQLPTGGESIDGVNSSDTGDGNNEDDNESNYVRRVSPYPSPPKRSYLTRYNQRLVYLPSRRYN